MRKTIFILLILGLMNTPAFADREGLPKDYQRDVDGGKYVFVMLAQHEYEVAHNKKLREMYSKSGLYLQGSKEPIWTVGWYASVHIDSAGRFLVREGPWPGLVGVSLLPGSPSEKSLEQLAVAFYDQGKLIKKYLIRDLIKNRKKLKSSVSHFRWQKEILFHDETKRLVIATLDDQKYVFDITTGNIIFQEFLKETKNAA